MDDVRRRLLKNGNKERLKEAVGLLTKIADNILQSPGNLRLRALKKSNKMVQNKVLSVDGAKQCLELMGFQDCENEWILPSSVPLSRLREVRDDLLKRLKDGANETRELIKPIVLPQLLHMYTNPFLREIEDLFNSTHAYEDQALLARAKRLIPIDLLSEGAVNRLRNLQLQCSKLDTEMDVLLSDMVLLELLDWFKEDFFEWVDSPDCELCGAPSSFSHKSEDPALMVYTNRVEMHRCSKCEHSTPFARYNDLNILLETRRGRCGEWANVFTLLCVAAGFEARYVVCQTDHVWTEVYSSARGRWLHCDPCEAACDNPLMYEEGWTKQLSYVMAYGLEEVQDVTWRYSGKHKEVLKRRDKCPEEALTNALVTLNRKRQSGLNASRKKHLAERSLRELAEFLTEKTATKEAQVGRVSGSLDWRLARKETRTDSHMVVFDEEDEMGKTVEVRYSASLDVYEKVVGEEEPARLSEGWDSLTYDVEGVFRKVERDWKMAYLCREESQTIGSITWRFRISEALDSHIRNLHVHLDHQTFENGHVLVEIAARGRKSSSEHRWTGERALSALDLQPYNCREIDVKVTLSGGSGSAHWQHAQLFRQPLEDALGRPFVVKVEIG